MGSKRLTRRERQIRRYAAEVCSARRRAEREKARRIGDPFPQILEKASPRLETPTPQIIERFFFAQGKPAKTAVWGGFLTYFATSTRSRGRKSRNRLRSLLICLARRAPALLQPGRWEAIDRLVELTWVRPVEDWVPRGKAPDAVLISLAGHLTARYPVPAFLYGAFFTQPASYLKYDPMVFYRCAAEGKSIHALFSEKAYYPRMTRRMSHLFMRMKAGMSIPEAARTAQVLASGGSAALARELCRSSFGDRFSDFEDRVAEFISWLCREREIDFKQLGNVVQYFWNLWWDDQNYSLKGRTFASVSRDARRYMDQWSVQKKLTKTTFEPSGFRGATWTVRGMGDNGTMQPITWTMRELLTARDIRAEGTAMRHCVFTYAIDVEEKRCSLWSLRRDDRRMLTVEVDTADKQIVEAKGKCDRDPEPREIRMLKHWAAKNGLSIEVNL